MSKIVARKWLNGDVVLVRHKDLFFGYRRPPAKDLKRQGRKLEISTRGRNNMTISLNGTQINTLKKILMAAGEI